MSNKTRQTELVEHHACATCGHHILDHDRKWDLESVKNINSRYYNWFPCRECYCERYEANEETQKQTRILMRKYEEEYEEREKWKKFKEWFPDLATSKVSSTTTGHSSPDPSISELSQYQARRRLAGFRGEIKR